MNPRRIVASLREGGHLAEDQVKNLLGRLGSTGGGTRELLDGLLECGAVGGREEGLRLLARQFGMDYVDLESLSIPPDLTGELDASSARRYGVLPLRRSSRGFTLAVAEPPGVRITDDLGVLLGEPLEFQLADPDVLQAMIDRHYGVDGNGINTVLEEAAPRDPAVTRIREVEDPSRLEKRAREASVVKLVDRIVLEAVRQGSSDIHLEPQKNRFLIRYRIDGVLHEVHELPRPLEAPIVSRFKIMAEVDIAEHRRPQDGRIQMKVGGDRIDFRFSTLPSIHGESVVLRVLDRGSVNLDLQELGFLPGDRARFEALVRRPHGILLVTGPTGSGKTTTLYSALSELNDPRRKLVGVEDPVEYQVEGINQMQVNRDIGLDFALGLRTLLRQNPDVILVGEIRDRETADVAVEAALTGHLVLSTLHTRDAPGALERLMDLGISRYRLASAIQAVISQRLVRTVCSNCRESYEPDPEELRRMGFTPDELPDGTLDRGAGCASCHGTGYSGRTALFEILVNSEAATELILEGASTRTLRTRAREEGMRPLRRDGLVKVRRGWTTPMEVARVTRATGVGVEAT